MATPKKPFRRLWLLLTWASLLYLIAVCAGLYLLDHCTEGQWYLSPLLYLPPQGWLLPLAGLVPLALWLRPAMLALHGLAFIAVVLGFMHFASPKTSVANVPADSVLTVVTANIGQRKAATLQPFLDEMSPDIITFQEGAWPEPSFAEANPGYEYRRAGEFTLASKLPIGVSGVVPDLTFEGREVAARFELATTNGTLVIYSVHMPTPRAYLYDLRGEGLLADADHREGVFSRAAWDDYRYYWSSRFDLARGLLAALAKEKHPVILCGDFNTPDHGALYQLFAARYTDAFATAGQGYGLTFPGDIHAALAGYRPWLRLDYQFADASWEPVEAIVEPLKRTQHLAVSASYRFVGEK
jgi:vancomycin resistance protein VanJ